MEGVGGRAIGPGQDRGGAQRLERGGERVDVVRAGVRPEARAQRQQHAGRVGGRLDLHARLARVGRRGQVLAPGLDPLHRAPGAAGQRGHRQVLGHHVHLLAEAAAGIGHDHAHARLGQAEGAGDPGPEDVRHLAARPERERVALPARDHPAALERRGRAARVGEGLADHDGGGREGAVHVALAAAALEEHVGGRARGAGAARAGSSAVATSGTAGSGSYSTWTSAAAVHRGVGRGPRRPPPPARRRSARERSAARARRSRRSRAPRAAARAGRPPRRGHGRSAPAPPRRPRGRPRYRPRAARRGRARSARRRRAAGRAA